MFRQVAAPVEEVTTRVLIALALSA